MVNEQQYAAYYCPLCGHRLIDDTSLYYCPECREHFIGTIDSQDSTKCISWSYETAEQEEEEITQQETAQHGSTE